MDYAFVGKKGTGKSKNVIRLARDRYLAKGRRVATNLDINLEAMFGKQSRHTYIRVPDKPTAWDLLAAGHGNPESYEEEKNGMLALDELGTWLNTRTFGDKGRTELLDFFAHGRKHGWDGFYIMQAVAQVDKQLRESFIEQTVRHIRFDRIKWPFVGGLLGVLFGERAAYMPKFHVATARIGVNPQDLVADRAMFTGKDVEACYDTRQVFQLDYPHGTHSVLSPWHVTGRFLVDQKKAPWWQTALALAKGVVGVGPVARPPLRPALTVPDAGYARARELVMRLPADQRIPLLRRYAMAAGATASPSASAGGGAARSAA